MTFIFKEELIVNNLNHFLKIREVEIKYKIPNINFILNELGKNKFILLKINKLFTFLLLGNNITHPLMKKTIKKYAFSNYEFKGKVAIKQTEPKGKFVIICPSNILKYYQNEFIKIQTIGKNIKHQELIPYVNLMKNPTEAFYCDKYIIEHKDNKNRFCIDELPTIVYHDPRITWTKFEIGDIVKIVSLTPGSIKKIEYKRIIFDWPNNEMSKLPKYK